MKNDPLPLVTIGIPTYNRGDSYLKQALRSAVEQTYPNIEIIVSDNCSTDNTESVVKLFTDSRIRYFKQSVNIGPAKNPNFCLEQARGEYFMLLHDDDLIDSDMIEICMRAAQYKTDVGLIRTGIRLIDSDLKVRKELFNRLRGPSMDDFIFSWFADETVPYLCGSLFNTEKLREIGGFKSKHNLFEDVMAEFQLAARFGKIDIENIKGSYRMHSEEMTYTSTVNDWCEDALMLLDMLCEVASDERKKLVRNEGMKFFSIRMYRMAAAVKSPFRRFIAYMTVFRHFNYKFLPPPLFSFLYHNIYINTGLRKIHRQMKKKLTRPVAGKH